MSYQILLTLVPIQTSSIAQIRWNWGCSFYKQHYYLSHRFLSKFRSMIHDPQAWPTVQQRFSIYHEKYIAKFFGELLADDYPYIDHPYEFCGFQRVPKFSTNPKRDFSNINILYRVLKYWHFVQHEGQELRTQLGSWSRSYFYNVCSFW